MDKGGVELAVLSNVATVQGDADPAAALRLAREANDHLAEVVRARPDKFAAFATTPLQDPAAGAAELERAVTQLGVRGTMLFGQTAGRYLDDRSSDPFWERAQALNVPVYLHAADAAVLPASLAGRPELVGYWSASRAPAWCSATSGRRSRSPSPMTPCPARSAPWGKTTSCTPSTTRSSP
jgi:2,3-dihydroxybenzoate decarboxylase